MVATEKLWLTEDRSELVADGDPRAAFLFCTPGKTISPADADRYGLKEADPASDKADDVVENKGEDANPTGSGLTINRPSRRKS